MGQLQNAVSLMRDGDLLALVTAALVAVAREVVTEAATVNNHAVRLKMASVVVSDPSRHAVQVTNAVAANPAVADLGTTAADIPEATIMTNVRQVWTPIAQMFYTEE